MLLSLFSRKKKIDARPPLPTTRPVRERVVTRVEDVAGVVVVDAAEAGPAEPAEPAAVEVGVVEVAAEEADIDSATTSPAVTEIAAASAAMTVPQLRLRAKELGLHGYSRLPKAGLLELITGTGTGTGSGEQ